MLTEEIINLEEEKREKLHQILKVLQSSVNYGIVVLT